MTAYVHEKKELKYLIIMNRKERIIQMLINECDQGSAFAPKIENKQKSVDDARSSI